MPSLVCIFAGLLAGVAGGLFGVGGGVIIVPFLVLALHFDQHRAQGTSLFALALPVAGLGAYNYYSKGSVDFTVGLSVAAGIAIGGIAGSKIAHGLKPKTMRRIFCVFLVVIAAYIFFKSEILHSQPFDADAPLPSWAIPASLLAGVFAGISGGLFGIGGGIIAVPFMVLAFAFPQHLAQGTSLLALTLPVAAPGAYHYYKNKNVDVVKALCLAIGIVCGSFAGSQFALGLDPVVMQRSFAVFAVAMAAYIFFKK